MTLRQKTITGLSWSFVGQIGKQASQFVITASLARLLSTTDFGLIGMATVFSGFMSIFSDMGISSALIQRKEVVEEHLSTAFWINIACGFSLTALFWLAAPGIALFYHSPQLTEIVRLLSFSFMIAAFGVVQQSVLMREMDFRGLMIRDLAAVIVSGAVGIALAVRGMGVKSLVIQQLVFVFVNTIVLWWFSSWKPRWLFSVFHLRELQHFSTNTTGFQIANYISRNVDYLLIGRFLGSDALGLYTLAYKLMMVPLQNISWVVHRVLFPAFSKIQDDLSKMRENYLRLIKAIALISFPIMVGLLVMAHEFVILVYGAAWEGAAEPIRILALCGLIQSVSTTTGIIFMSRGKVEVLLRLAIVNTLITAGMILAGVRYGLTGVASFYLVSTLVVANIGFFIVCRMLHLRVTALYAALRVPILYSTLLLLGLLTAKHLFHLGSWFSLLAVGLASATAYFFLIRKTLRQEGWLLGSNALLLFGRSQSSTA